MFESIIINGLINGGVYALLAVGFSLVFGVARIINLSYTAFYMLAAYTIYALSQLMGLNPFLSILLSIVLVSVLGVATFKILIEPVREHTTTVMIMTVALAMIIQELSIRFFGGHFRGLPSLVSGYVIIMGVRVTFQYIFTFTVMVIVLSCLWYILKHTRLGIAIRAMAQDREVSNLMGIDVSRIALVTVLITVIMAAIAGALVAPLRVIEPHMWMHPLIIVLAIVVLGGLGSVKGSLIAAFILAFAETSFVFLVPMGSYLKGALSLTVMILVLLIRPEGLFGVNFEGER